VIFPNEKNIKEIPGLIKKAGGVETCFAGVGIHGHLAFNEPQSGVQDTEPRLTQLNPFTVTMNAIRAGVGGDIKNFPDRAWTLGMKQCLGARRIRVYCRNDVAGLQWANTVLRLAVLGKPGDDYPVTWIRNHSDWKVITDRDTAASPQNLL
jgi:glucosamine-6-phosphate deaminase